MGETRTLKLFIPFILLCLLKLDPVHGQSSNIFLTKNKDHIEKYIMNGYGWGWKHCDIMNDLSQQTNYFDETPKFVMDLNRLGSFDIKTLLSSSYCLLISGNVHSNQTLSDLIKFGWSVVQHKRLALVLKLSQGMTLEMAKNATKLPFLVAATRADGKEQFLCPFIGEKNPRLQDTRCDVRYSSYKNKTLRVGTFGTPPYMYGKFTSLTTLFKNISNKNVTTVGKNGPDGANRQLLQTLAEKFNFKFAFKVADGYVDASNMVSNEHIHI